MCDFLDCNYFTKTTIPQTQFNSNSNLFVLFKFLPLWMVLLLLLQKKVTSVHTNTYTFVCLFYKLNDSYEKSIGNVTANAWKAIMCKLKIDALRFKFGFARFRQPSNATIQTKAPPGETIYKQYKNQNYWIFVAHKICFKCWIVYVTKKETTKFCYEKGGRQNWQHQVD